MRCTRKPAYRRHKASGLAVCTLMGRDHYLGTFGSRASKRKYDQLINEWLAAGRPKVGTSGNNLSIAELIKRFKAWAEKRYVRDGKLTGEADNYRYALRPVRKLYGETRAVDFGP